MILFDVSVLLNAHRAEQPYHALARDLLQRTVEDRGPFALAEPILVSFVRIVSHPRALRPPTPLPDALSFCEGLRARPNARLVAPGRRHWGLFDDLCRRYEATGNLAGHAHLAALAIEWGCRLISFDRDFARFAELDWRSPADER